MKNVLIASLLLLGWSCWSGCAETLTPAEQAAADQEIIESYVADAGVVGTYTSSGLFISNTVVGDTTARPTLSDDVTVIYKGELLNGNVFDSSNGNEVTFPLNLLIPGWQEGIQLMGRGTQSVLLIPSADAYGPAGSGSIPGNSVLRFDITLVDFE